MLELGLFGKSRVRLIRQIELTECGLACLAMVAQYHGLGLGLAALRRRFALSSRGASLRALMRVSTQIGLIPRALNVPLEQLPNIQMPCILHWDTNHFVVLEEVRGNKALIHDPNGSTAWIPLHEVSHHFTGVALELRPSVNFVSHDDKDVIRLPQLWQSMTGLKRALAQVLLLSVVLQAFVLVSPYYMQVAIDKVLPAQDSDLLVTLAFGFGLFAIINAAATLLRAFVLVVAGNTLGFSLASNIAHRLFRLPISWFERRNTGDILSRFQSISPIRELLTQGAIGAVLDGVMAVATLLFMFWYSSMLAAIALLALAAHAVIRLAFFSYEKDAQAASIVTRGKEQTMMIESLRGMPSLRLLGREELRHAQWQTRYADAVNSDVRLSRLRIWQDTATSLIFAIENIVFVWIAIGLVIDGAGFSVGMVFAYLTYKTQFITRATALVGQFLVFRMIGLHLERLSDIALSEEDRGFISGTETGLRQEIDGFIEMRAVEYAYSPHDPPVLNGVNLFVEPGEHVAITGPSGGGKSTLVKILLGLIEPDAGQVLIDGVELGRFGYRNYRGYVAAVLQEDNLFSGTLADNIALFDDEVDMDRVTAAARTASIHTDIIQMPMQYETLVGDMGSTLSGGQKQRVLLARALYRRPRILIMDEGTAHLDAAHERAVSNAISALGITRIIVAHRRETIEAADRIIVMEHGRLHAPTGP